jgi:large repetitive protein
LITGTPTATGTSSVVVTLTDGTGFQTTRSYSVTINGPPSITTASLPAGETTVAYSMTMAASGGTTPYVSWTVSGGMPAGLSLSTGGVISGTPTASGVFPLNITVIDTAGASASLPFTLTIAQGPTITTASLPNGEVGAAYPGVTLAGSGGTAPYTWTSTALPAGLTLNGSTGVISGTPTGPNGTTSVTITIHDSNGATSSKSLSLTIGTAPTITTASLPNGALTIPYNTTLAASGGTTPYGWSETGTMPPGLSLNAGTGAITGTPTATGTYPVTYTVRDSVGGTASKSLSITINPQATVTTVTPASRGQGFTGTVTINGTGFIAGAPLAATFSNLGITVNSIARTSGTTLTANITIAGGAATGAGTVTVVNGDGSAASGSAAFTVNAKPTITSINPASHSRNSTFNITVTGTGFVSGATFAFSGPGGAPTINTTTPTNSTTMTINVSAGGTRFTSWNLTVTNPDGGTFTLNNAYTTN